MPTRSGRIFSIGETSASMNPSLQNTLKTLIARMDQMDQQLLEFRDQTNSSYHTIRNARNQSKDDCGRGQVLGMTVGQSSVSELNPTI